MTPGEGTPGGAGSQGPPASRSAILLGVAVLRPRGPGGSPRPSTPGCCSWSCSPACGGPGRRWVTPRPPAAPLLIVRPALFTPPGRDLLRRPPGGEGGSRVRPPCGGRAACAAGWLPGRAVAERPRARPPGRPAGRCTSPPPPRPRAPGPIPGRPGASRPREGDPRSGAGAACGAGRRTPAGLKVAGDGPDPRA